MFESPFQQLEKLFQFSKRFSSPWNLFFNSQKCFPEAGKDFLVFKNVFQLQEFIFVFFLAFSRGWKRVEGILMSKKNPYQTSQPDTDQTNNKLYLYEKTNTTNLIQFGYFPFI